MNKKEQLLETALKLYVTEGLAVPSLRIAREAGVATPILLDCYPEKQDIVDALYLRLQEEIDTVFLEAGALDAGETREVMAAAWASYARWAIAHPQRHQALRLLTAPGVLSHKLASEPGGAFKLFGRAVERGIKKGWIADIGFEYVSQLMTAQIEVSIAQAAAYQLKGKTLDGHIQLGFGIFWKGISA